MPLRRRFRKHFDLQKQRDFITHHGTQVVVFPCLQCPCLTPERQADPICLSCHGTGRLYLSRAKYVTKVLNAKDRTERMYQEVGTWTAGPMQVTLLPGVHLAERDKIQLVDIRAVFNDEVLIRGLDDTVRFAAGVQLELVADLTSTVYRPDIDYTLTFPNTVTWLSGGIAPAFGAQYAVRYNAYPEYEVTPNQPGLRIEHQVSQAQVVTLLRLDKLDSRG